MIRLLSIFSASVLLLGCSTPDERANAQVAADRRERIEQHRRLEEEARENFEREREREQERREELAEARREAAEDAAERARDIAERRREDAESAARYRAYEVEYARQLGKRPSQLTPAERAWVRDNFDD